jgi:hypothetical protein
MFLGDGAGDDHEMHEEYTFKEQWAEEPVRGWEGGGEDREGDAMKRMG